MLITIMQGREQHPIGLQIMIVATVAALTDCRGGELACR